MSYLNQVFSLSGVEIKDDMKLMVTSTASIYTTLYLYRETDPRILKNMIVSTLLTYMAPDGDEQIRKAFETFLVAQGYVSYNREDYCLRKILGYPDNIHYSYTLTYEYQQYYYNNNKLQKVWFLIFLYCVIYLNIDFVGRRNDS